MFNGAGGDRYVVSQWINVASYDKLRVQFQFRVGNSDWRLTTTCSGPDWDTNYPLFQYAVVSGTWNTVTSYGRMSTWAEEDYRITTNGATEMQLKWFQDDQAGCSLTINYALWGIDYVRLTGINCNFFPGFSKSHLSPDPRVYSVTSPSTDGGQVTITGAYFQSGCTATINLISCSSPTFISATSMTCDAAVCSLSF